MRDTPPERLSATLETLNARIARLAIGLGVDLNTSDAMEKLMKLPTPAAVSVERRKSVSDVARMHAPTSVERRIAHLHEELRGLLTLRFHIETLSVSENGLTATRQMVMQAHEHLLGQGFEAGADGLTAQLIQDLNESSSEKKEHERST